MGTLLTTELSAKRQITLPESICEALSLQTGSQFVILVQNEGSDEIEILIKCIIY